jgi:hypothetical protein
MVFDYLQDLHFDNFDGFDQGPDFLGQVHDVSGEIDVPDRVPTPAPDRAQTPAPDRVPSPPPVIPEIRVEPVLPDVGPDQDGGSLQDLAQAGPKFVQPGDSFFLFLF